MRGEICTAHGIPQVRGTMTNGAALLQLVMDGGGEGVCKKRLDATWYDAMIVAKRMDIWLCRVRGPVHGTQSVFIEDAASGQDRGRVALRGGKCDHVRPGSLIRVEAMAAHDSGKLRQPNPCRDWLVQY